MFDTFDTTNITHIHTVYMHAARRAGVIKSYTLDQNGKHICHILTPAEVRLCLLVCIRYAVGGLIGRVRMFMQYKACFGIFSELGTKNLYSVPVYTALYNRTPITAEMVAADAKSGFRTSKLTVKP